MKNRMLLVLSSVFFMILGFSGVLGFGPNTHVNMTNDCLSDTNTNSTLISQLIQDNLDACYSGLEYPDVGIFEYYTNFKDYAGTHNYNVPDEMLRIAKNDRERAFAYCYKIHLAEDSISHNFFVPLVIKRTKIPDYLVHPVVELRVEGKFLTPIANHLMERHTEFDKFVQDATGRDWSSEAAKLNTIIGGGQFYSKAYNPDTGTSWGQIQNKFYALLVKFVPVNTELLDYKKQATEECKAVLRGETNDLDPSGELSLNSADSQTQLFLYVGSIVIILAIFILSFYFRIIGFSQSGFKDRHK